MKLEIKRIGNSTGLILPRDLVGRLKLEQGDWLYVTENTDGTVRLSPYDPTFEKGMKIAEKATKTYRNTLAELAPTVEQLVLHVPFMIEMRNVPFREQRQVLEYLVSGFPSFGGGHMDQVAAAAPSV